MTNLASKRALVTGGSRGIGAAIVRRLVADGASVVINYRNGKEAAEGLAAELNGSGPRVVAEQADVTDPDSTRTLVRRTVDALGGLDILVSNAGVEHFGALTSITTADYERVFTTNVAGQLFATQAAAGGDGRGRSDRADLLGQRPHCSAPSPRLTGADHVGVIGRSMRDHEALRALPAAREKGPCRHRAGFRPEDLLLGEEDGGAMPQT